MSLRERVFQSFVTFVAYHTYIVFYFCRIKMLSCLFYDESYLKFFCSRKKTSRSEKTEP